MFLVGGPAFSGTTLLALLLNQGDLICLDEPDFHDPAQSNRGIPVLEGLFPDRDFPARPQEPLAYDAAVELIEECERAIHPYDLGVKTCDWPFLAYAEVYERLGHPVVCIVRDIRDALVRPLPEWLTEQGLNERYRMIWARAQAADALVRYEDLVADAAAALGTVSAALGRPLTATLEWPAERVPRQMLKLDRHQLLQSGTISSSRVGVWRSAGRAFSDETHATARLMGYPDS